MRVNRTRAFAAIALLILGAPTAMAQGWQTTIYPIYAWAPVFGAEVRLPEVPSPPPCDGCGNGGPITPGGRVNSSFNGAAFAAMRIENSRIEGEFNFLWAGLSAEAERPRLTLSVGTILGAAHLGYKVAPDFSISLGVRRIGLNVKASALIFDEVQWKPGLWEGLIGASYMPRLSPTWRLVTHADYGGLGSADHSSFSAIGSVEWQPRPHFLLNLGYGLFMVNADGRILTRPIHLDQTLHGPIVGIGIPF